MFEIWTRFVTHSRLAQEAAPLTLGPARSSIISKGMIYSTDHGYLDFSVPLFAEFMRRRG
jgi:hypothetical protein